MATKVLLLEDIENVGHKGEITSVKEGFAFNYLLPQKKAQIADANAIRRQAKLQEERRVQAIEDKKAAEEIAGRLQGFQLEAHVKVDQDGHMYGSVSALDISHLLKQHTGLDFAKRDILLKHPIKETGTFEVTLRLKEGVSVSIHLIVVPEGV